MPTTMLGTAEERRAARRFSRILIGSVAFGFVAVAAVAAMALALLLRAQTFGALVDHTYQVDGAVSEFRVQFEQMETARRGYLLSGSPRYQAIYRQARGGVTPGLEKIASLTADNPQQQVRVAALRPLLKAKIELLDRSIELVAAGRRPQAVQLFNTEIDQSATDQLRFLSAQMSSEEAALLAERTAQQTASVRVLFMLIVGAGVLLLLLAVGSLWSMRRYADDLRRSRSELHRLNVGLEEAVSERTGDLKRANEEIQRFAYIVSHDLRSPLVNVMGFTAELEIAAKALKGLLQAAETTAPDIVTPEAKSAVEVDLPESIGFIRTSTQRMDRLINSILKLSREGRRVLAAEPVAMGKLLRGVSDNFEQQKVAAGAEVIVEEPMPDLVSDRLALEQVFSNLIENALKYLKPGRPGHIVVRGRSEPGRAIFEVEDNGRGIDPRDHERIFDLFRRAGVQDKPGEGIGLAHVRALVYRMGGLISCESALDQGSTFRISLPLRPGKDKA